MSEAATQAELFEETLVAWRSRVCLLGGTTEEHYAIRHIDALEADLRQAESQVAALREALRQASEVLMAWPHPSYCDPMHEAFDAIKSALANTEAASKAHDQRVRLEGYEQARRELLAGQAADKIEGDRAC